jgi:hypothetical protein
MRIEMRLADEIGVEQEAVEEMFRWRLATFADELRLVSIDVRHASASGWVRCRLRLSRRAGDPIEVEGTGPDALACVRHVLHRAKRLLRRRASLKPNSLFA